MSLHASRNTLESSSCECPPEYYCAYVCEEENSAGTVISWQHFPQSTSQRFVGDSSSEEVRKSIDDTVTSGDKESKKESETPSSTEYPIKKSIAQLNAQHYLEIRHIFELFNFLTGHLVCNEPENPVKFLVDLLDKCLKFRDSLGQPPLLFTLHHIKSLYSAFDPIERGYIDLQQYEEAMTCLGLNKGIKLYKEPLLNEEGYVEENFFTFEAERCLTDNLTKMLKIPKPWEEKRLLWQKKNAKVRVFDTTSEFEEEYSYKSNQIENEHCKCCDAKPVANLICRCPKPAKRASQTSIKPFEPEQLFLKDFS